MKNPFLSRTPEEKVIEAVERLKFTVQYALQAAMHKHGVDQAGLAERLGVTPARVSQMFADGANLRLNTVAKAFAVLREDIFFRSETVPEILRMGEEDRPSSRQVWASEEFCHLNKAGREVVREYNQQVMELQVLLQIHARNRSERVRPASRSSPSAKAWRTFGLKSFSGPAGCSAANEVEPLRESFDEAA